MRYALLDGDRIITNIIEIEPDVAAQFDAHYLGDNALGIGDAYPETDFVPGQTLDTLKISKRQEASAACQADIYAGLDIATSDGETHHYSFTLEDQINLKAWYDECKAGAAGAPYHADGQPCKRYPAADIITICDALLVRKVYALTYCNALYQWIARCETVDELSAITYGATLPDDLAAEMQEVLASAQSG